MKQLLITRVTSSLLSFPVSSRKTNYSRELRASPIADRCDRNRERYFTSRVRKIFQCIGKIRKLPRLIELLQVSCNFGS